MVHLLIGDPIIDIALILFLYYTCLFLIKLVTPKWTFLLFYTVRFKHDFSKL
jgi:hypothetical protein